MKELARVADVRRWRASQRGSVGLVPTMGYLHAGHVSLVERARRDNDHVAVSLFVNPTQFGPAEDLSRYPRDLDRDRALLEQAGCDLLFAPGVEDMYPHGPGATVDPGEVAHPLEGERRPGHFRGVATVVLKLLNIVHPHRAYFGQKDAQQLAVIRSVVRDLDVPIDIVGCPIVREPDGLALSSRNVYLDADDRRAAPVLYRALLAARRCYEDGERSGDALRTAVRGVLAEEPRARVDYVSVADPLTFRELDVLEGPALVSMAVFVGRARLIDNLVLPVVSEASGTSTRTGR
jgi:pantoate--beta-alanine ligase